MRKLVLGLGEDGTTRVLEEVAVAFSEVLPGIGWDTIFETAESPPPSRPQGDGDLLPMGVDPGLVRWNVMEWGAGAEVPRPHTDTLDFDTVLTGSVELILDDGSHNLVSGDCVVVPGIDHAWRAGPEGCQVSCVFFGTPPPS
jgi:quercetin dioxygenase-like cupin family protein